MGVNDVSIEGESRTLVGHVKLEAGSNVELSYNLPHNSIVVSAIKPTAQMEVYLNAKYGENQKRTEAIINPIVQLKID